MSGSGFAASGAKPAVNIRNNYDVSTSKGKTGYELVDFNVSASASMLPPLASGARPAPDMSGTNQYVARQQSNPKPEDFQINLADSQPSLDFDISGSVGAGLGSRLGKSNKLNNNLNASKQSFKGEKDEYGLSGSLDSKDF